MKWFPVLYNTYGSRLTKYDGIGFNLLKIRLYLYTEMTIYCSDIQIHITFKSDVNIVVI